MRTLSTVLVNRAYQPAAAEAAALDLDGTLKIQTLPNGDDTDAHHIIDGPGWHAKFG